MWAADMRADRPQGHIVLRPARPEDLAAMLALLEREGLPTAGVGDWLRTFVVAVSGERVIGVAGLEVYGSDGLLRSVAVERGWRGRGFAERLTGEVLNSARREGIGTVYLLTETAAAYFSRRGFVRTERKAVSEAVRGSAEFRDLCPASAVVMAIRVEQGKESEAGGSADATRAGEAAGL